MYKTRLDGDFNILVLQLNGGTELWWCENQRQKIEKIILIKNKRNESVRG